jgi:hypothetical protein
MTFQFWQPSYGTNLDPYAAKGKRRAVIFAQNFNLYNNLDFDGILTQAQILSHANEAIYYGHFSVFCELIGMSDQCEAFSKMLIIGGNLRDLETLGDQGVSWFILHSLGHMEENDFSRMLYRGGEVKGQSAAHIMDTIANRS